MFSRRYFLEMMAVPAALRFTGRSSASVARSSPPVKRPIIGSLVPVVDAARHVSLHEQRIAEVAGWMAYEGLPWPDFRSPLTPDNDADTMDFIFLTSTINFAFTDFDTHTIFTAEYGGTEYSDSLGMEACLKRAYDEGRPILDGNYLASVTKKEVEAIFTGNIPMPMLDQRVEIFHEVGRVLESRYQGRFHNFVADAPNRLYSRGRGLLERLLEEFPSFRDTSQYRGRKIEFQKRAQLLWWQLYAAFRKSGFFTLEDPELLTVFADYIVPVALRVMGITSYSDELERAINAREVVPADSEEEIEIRAMTIWACDLLTLEINQRRPEDRHVIAPVVDSRLWTHYHTTHWPHHLTITTDY